MCIMADFETRLKVIEDRLRELSQDFWGNNGAFSAIARDSGRIRKLERILVEANIATDAQITGVDTSVGAAAGAAFLAKKRVETGKH